MSDSIVPPGATSPAAPASPPASGRGAGFLVLAAVLCALPAWGLFEWFLCRIEVAKGQVAVLIAKTGRDLPSGQILAGPGEKGIRLASLPPGRYFQNPFFWDWHLAPMAEVPPGKVGVLIRLFGQEPRDGRILVDGPLEPDDPTKVEKGILRQLLGQGTHRINPFAYRLELHDAVEIAPGHVGVVTNLVGNTPAKRNAYVSEPGERGVPRATLGPGTHYVNPYAVRILPVDVRQRRLDFSYTPQEVRDLAGDPRRQRDASDHVAIVFPSSDGFEILVKLAVVWQIDPARAAEAFVRISTTGDMRKFDDEVIHKVLTPSVRGYARIEGSKFEATQYISGASRSTFQHALFEKVRAACVSKGIVIHEVLVSDIEPPPEIAEPIRQREIAKEELARNGNQIKQARSEQSLARQTELVKQERAKVEIGTKKLQRVIGARNAQDVALIEQEQKLEVAKTDLAAAKAQASAIASRGQADVDVILAQNEAEAEPLKRSVEAFKTPQAFASYVLARRLAPGVRGVFADPSSAFGKIFTDLLEPASGAARKGE